MLNKNLLKPILRALGYCLDLYTKVETSVMPSWPKLFRFINWTLCESYP